MITTTLVLLGALLLGVPVAFSIGVAAIAYFVTSGANLLVFSQQFVGQLSGLPLVAIPFFILAGELMTSGGVTRRIFDFALAIVGRIPGSLGHANVVSSMIFAGMSGSAMADVASLGKLEFRTMRDYEYPEDLSMGVTVASATLGPIIPPSINMVIYGSMANIPIGLLFLGGIGPGVLCGLLLVATFAILFRVRGVRTLRIQRVSFWIALRRAWWAILTPVVLLGAMFGGVATPTEAAVLAALYATLVSGLIYRELTVVKFLDALLSTAMLSGAVLLIIAFSAPLGYIIAREQIATGLARLLFQTLADPTLVLCGLVVLLLFLGCFLEVATGLILLAPVLAPSLAALGLNPVLTGVFIVFGMGVGLITPPVGMCLYVGSQISEMKIERVAVAALPFVVAFSLLGLPALSIPCGSTSTGLPIGLQIVGRRLREALIPRQRGN
jgi:tripartite ATP-independent transporter DctM subunit